ncbi:MAG TPA: helix-turn-helix domain-containing protein [Baekduia sp.]|nr:helix-turn-helix domain-containing protein [Baekduia sp.]
MASTYTERCSPALAGLVAWLLESADELAGAMAAEIHEQVEELPDELHDESLRVCRAHLSTIATLLRDGLEPRPDLLPTEAGLFARAVARHALPVDAVARKYRVGHAALVRLATDALSAMPLSAEELRVAMGTMLDWTFRYVDVMTRVALEAHQDELAGWLQTADAARAHETRAVLRGEAVAEEEASRRIAYELARTHLAVVCWADADDVSAAELEAAVDAARRLAGAEGRMTLELGRGVLAGWVSGFTAPDPEALRAGWRGAVRGDAISIAIGDALPGIDGFRRSHEQAMICQRVAKLRCRRRTVAATYAETALVDLLTQDLDAADMFVRRELGPLADDDDATRRVASTVRVYFDEGCSHIGAARRLGVHGNTVAYRVQKAGRLLGRPVEERQMETSVALLLLDVLRRVQPRVAV